MVKVVESPTDYKPEFEEEVSVFLAGGITDCPDWQEYAISDLDDTSLVLLNPRRADFPIGNPDAAQAQIKWEYDHLRKADGILFWFPQETLCPIVLFELGAWSMTDKQIWVACHPLYPRRQDVEIQMSLARPDVHVLTNLMSLCDVVRAQAPGLAVPRREIDDTKVLVQLDGETWEELDSEKVTFRSYLKTAPAEAVQILHPFKVETLEGTFDAKERDYLMRGPAGELYSCDREIFENTYEAM